MNMIFEIMKTLPKSKKYDSLWARFFIRPLSYFFTWIAVKLGVSATSVSVFSIFISVLGCLLLIFNDSLSRLIGVVLIEFWLVLDCVDGNVARYTKTTSLKGEFFDAISGYFIYSFVFISIGVSAYYRTSFISDDYKYILIVLGSIASVSNILYRLIHQKFLNVSLLYSAQNKVNDKYSLNLKKMASNHVIWIAYQFNGIFLPWLIFAYFFDWYYQIVIFYAIYYFFELCLYSSLYCYKMFKL